MSEIKSPSGMNSQGASSRLRPLGGRWGGGISTGRVLNSSGNGGGAAAAATAAAAFAPVPREVGAGPAFQVLGLFIHQETHYTAMVRRGGIIYHIDSRLVQSNNGRRVYVVSPELLVAYVTRFAAGRGRGSGSGVGGVFRVFYLGYDPLARPAGQPEAAGPAAGVAVDHLVVGPPSGGGSDVIVLPPTGKGGNGDVDMDSPDW